MQFSVLFLLILKLFLLILKVWMLVISQSKCTHGTLPMCTLDVAENNRLFHIHKSIAIILGQKIGILPIHDLYIRFLGGMDIELVEHHHLLVP